jgi:hypothetical protein
LGIDSSKLFYLDISVAEGSSNRGGIYLMEVYYQQHLWPVRELFALRFRITLIHCENPENSVY